MFTYDVPITTEIYARIKEGLGPKRPPGLIAHLTLQIENGLHPVVHPILEGMLGFVPPEPSHTMLDVVDVWTDRHPA